MLADLFAIIAPVFLAAALGFGWARTGRPFEIEFVTALVVNIGTPCLVLGTMLKLSVTPAAFAELAGATLLLYLAVGLAALALLRAAGQPLNVFLPALMFPNAGNMGLPLCLFAFGQPGLSLGIAFFAVSSVLQFTVGQSIAAGRGRLGLVLRTPLVYAVLLGVALALTGTQVPRWLFNSIELLGGLTIPLMLIALGVSLARLRVTTFGRSLAMAALRLALGFAAGAGLAWALGLEGAARGVLIVQSTMPAAVFNYLFAQRYQNAPEEVAGIVVLSTAMAFALLPALLWFVLPN